MLKRLSAIAASAVLLFGLTGCSVTKQDTIEVTKALEVPPKMAFFGDSIPDGFGLEGYSLHHNTECASYPNLLKEKYEAELSGEKCGTSMTNYAVSGDDSQDLIDLLKKTDDDEALRDADAVVISIGGNDLLPIVYEACAGAGVKFNGTKVDISGVDVAKAASDLMTSGEKIDKAIDQFGENLNEIVDLLDERTDAQIYVQTLYNPLEPYCEIPVFGEFMLEKIDALNSAIKDNSDGKYIVIDVASAFEGKAEELTNIAKNDVHPNADGHALIAEEVDKAFRQTGFTYTCEELGSVKLSGLGYALIISAVLLTIVMLVFISKMFKKKS